MEPYNAKLKQLGRKPQVDQIIEAVVPGTEIIFYKAKWGRICCCLKADYDLGRWVASSIGNEFERGLIGHPRDQSQLIEAVANGKVTGIKIVRLSSNSILFDPILGSR